MLEMLHRDARETLCAEIDAFDTCRSRDDRKVVRAAAMLDRIERVRFFAIMRTAYA